MRSQAKVTAAIVAAGLLYAGSAAADLKIAFIDPLSGGAATTGILAQKTHQFYVDAINAAGGLNGEKIELLSFDNKVNPQESLIQLKKAIDDGVVKKGMIPKLEESFASIAAGVAEVHIVGKLSHGDLAREVREPGSVGTVLVP